MGIYHHSKRIVLLLLALAIAGIANSAFAQGTAFTYQGRLQDGGTSANGNYDFQFTLWDALSGGTQQPQPAPVTVTKSNVVVTNGVFTTQLDFGAAAFSGADRFLETSVSLSGTATFTLLSPRQPITSTPYAMRSASAASADSVPVSALPSGSGNYIQNSTSQQQTSNFNISGNGTLGGSLQADSVRAISQYRIGNATDPVLAAPNTNLFVGIGSGIANTGSNNTLLGFNAGKKNSTGNNNTFVGGTAGVNNTIGSANSFFGFGAGGANQTGTDNSFFGYFAGLFHTQGNQNSLFGAGAGGQTTTGSNNSFFGNTTGISNTTESLNSLLGSFADTAPGISNATAIGFRAKVAQSNSLVLGSIAGINSAGFSTNVGIGTTTPNARLHVVGDTNLVGNLTVSGTLNATLPTNSASYIQNTSSQQASSNFNISGNGTVGGNLFASGNVGIGTTSPIGRLNVVGSAGPTQGIQMDNREIKFRGDGSAHFSIFANRVPGTLTIEDTSSNNGMNAAGALLLSIASGSGNVGIGTNGSAAALDVRRNGTISSDWQTGQLRISGASDPNMQLSLGYDTSSNVGAIQAGQAFTAFKTLSLNPFGGNVGIGTTSPTFKLHVNGETRTDTLSVGNYVANNGGPPLCFNTSNNRVAVCTSSLRYKTNVLSFQHGLDIIQRLRPISFTWREGGMSDIGLGAEEVEKVEPLLTYRNKKGDVEGVRYNQLSAVFINAFKEQQAQIQQQREQLKRQQEQIKRQEDQARQQRATFGSQQEQLDALKKLVCQTHRRAAVCR